VGLSTVAIFTVLAGYFLENLEMRPSLLFSDMQFIIRGRMDLMYRRVAKLTKQKKKKHNMQVKGRHGKLLTEEEEVKCRWKEYIEELELENRCMQDKVWKWSRRAR